MPPLPKKKHSRARKGGRAAHHGLSRIGLSNCPSCGATRLPHRACAECGYYNGRYAVTTVSDDDSPGDAESTAATGNEG